MPNTSPELAPTKLAWFSFLPRVSGLVEPLAAVGWSRSSLCDARWGLPIAGTLVLLELLDVAGVPQASPGKPWACDLAGGLPGAPPPSHTAAPPRSRGVSFLAAGGRTASLCLWLYQGSRSSSLFRAIGWVYARPCQS